MTRSTTRYAASLTAAAATLVMPLILSLTPPSSTGLSANPLPTPIAAAATVGVSPGQLT